MGKFTLTQIDKILALGVFYLATKGTCGNPRVRPISSYIVHNGKLYFGTSKNKNLYKHIEQHSVNGSSIPIFDCLILLI